MKKKYIIPSLHTQRINFALSIATMSEGEHTDGQVNDPGQEVDAGNALSKGRGLWQDANPLW